MICPAVIFANNRIVKAKGFVIIPINSTTAIIGNSHTGIPGIANICRQYDLFAYILVINNVNNDNTNVTEIFPVTFAPLGKKVLIL